MKETTFADIHTWLTKIDEYSMLLNLYVRCFEVYCSYYDNISISCKKRIEAIKWVNPSAIRRGSTLKAIDVNKKPLWSL